MESRPTVVTVSLNPAVDWTMSIPEFSLGRVNRVTASCHSAGGKGINVAAFVADMGIDVAATGFLGAENTLLFEELMARKHIGDRFIRIPGFTRQCLKISDEATRKTTEINLPGLSPSERSIGRLSDVIASLASQRSWFALSGSVPEDLAPDIYGRWMELIRARGGRVAVDTSQRPLGEALRASPDIVKPNTIELEEWAGCKLGTLREVCEVALSLQDGGVGLVVVSMGEEGAVFINKEEILLARPPKVPCHCTTGAGDAMVSGILCAQVMGANLRACAILSTALGAYAVTQHPDSLDRRRLEAYRAQVVIEEMSRNGRVR